MPINRPKPLFKVASEFNVSTQSIVDTLEDKGLTASNRPNFKITPDMYVVLEQVYGEDKAKSADHERAKEAYESRRNQMMNQRNDSVTVDQFLEPLEDEEPEDKTPTASIEDDLLGGLEPVDEDSAPSQVEVTEETSSEDQIAEDKVEVDLETENEEERTNSVTEVVEEKLTSSSVSTNSDDEVASDEFKEVNETEKETSESKTTAASTLTEQTTESTSEDSSKDVKDEQTVVEAKQDVEEKGEETTPPQKPTSDAESEEDIIRGRAGKLKGTIVLGKAAFTSDISSDGQPRKKRKRKKDRPDTPAGTQEKSTTKPTVTTKKKSKKKVSKTEVDEIDVDRMMKETLKKIQGGSTVGNKRGKRRRQRKEEREEELQLQQEQDAQGNSVIEVTEFITANDLAEELEVSVTDIISACMSIGLMITINQRLDAGTIELVSEEFGKEVVFIDAEEMVEEFEEEVDDEADLQGRAPIITVMGHVDHGKTSLLDYIREARVAEGEAGGITQHVGAYEVLHNEKKITFLDTPGHEAFTAMRSRGAQATDIVILVVAADDSVMPQTIEAINHAKAAGVPMVVAINKMDKPGASPDKIKQQLSDHSVIVEDWGGSTQFALVSAKTGMGIADLLEKVVIEAELLELKANPDRRADGVVLESRLDKGKGIVANILVQNGTLKVGDPFVAGPCYGRVRAMENDLGVRITEAGPATPVQLTGFDEMPQAGDKIRVATDEKAAKEIANQRQQIRREQALRKTKHMTLDDLSRRMALGEVSELNIIIKADVDGSIEALSGALQKLGTEEVSVSIIHTGAGAISESDVLLASASDAIIIGFQVRPTAQARKLAENEEIDVRLFSVIYDAVDEVRDALEGLLSPEIKEQIMGSVEVREIFKVSKVGTIAGCYVTDGKIDRNNPLRIIRDGVVIYDGEIGALKRFKEDVKEVSSGYECGISIRNYNDLKVGDSFESYKMTEEKRTLDESN
ncbi:MAG: translation initiation factor IF-2 [Balneolaceae bacterium]|jgi:translation initiation factor IF-2|nr:translation initiation factor IF-2 [Balneolaceae bacterium]MBL6916568.1 translation initiation factor IF-2 [Balneolaceae bacterium]